ncbi:MAG: serine/threonine-protein kinase, partial [Planctomycetota bacterium]
MANEEEPQKYGRCLIEREIGRGARSVVYLAWHEGLQIPVAVKVMKKEEEEDDEQFAERFMREARIAAQLTHTNIVRVYDCGETPESYYLVLEYIEGESCKDRMARLGAFAWQDAARIVREVADGLNYAKQKGVIHRDLKPENIMLDSNENSRMADLGLAKEIAPGQASATADGDVLGTPYYMSPEQVRQPGEVDFRSDVYSLGATLYHMATGEVPFEAPTPFEIMTMHLNEPLPPPQQKKPDLPQTLCDIITRAMAKEPAERYQSYEDLLRDLDMLLVSEAPKAAGSPAVVPEGGPQVAAEEEPAAERLAREAEAAARLRRIKPGEMPVT